MKESVKGQFKTPLKTSVNSVKEDAQGGSSLLCGHLEDIGQKQVCQSIFIYPAWVVFHHDFPAQRSLRLFIIPLHRDPEASASSKPQKPSCRTYISVYLVVFKQTMS